MPHARVVVIALLLFGCLATQAQQVVATNPNVAVPPLVKFSGALTDSNGKPLTGVVGVTFLLYKDEQGGAPLWLETQNVTADKNGHYTAMLGSTTSTGLPADIFVAGEARWLAVQLQGQREQARVLLLSVPYALKAGDAQTLGGLPASAFVLAAPSKSGALARTQGNPGTTSNAAPPPAASDVTTTGGTVNTLPLFTTGTNIQSSAISQTGSGAAAKIGIGTTSPATTLDVKGTATFRGALTLPSTATATAASGANSQPQDLVATSFNSTTSTSINQTFQWQAEPAANDTATPSATMNLLFGSGATKPAETGLRIANNGQITFATGQTFPGAAQLNTANTFAQNQTINGSLTVGSGAAIGAESGNQALFVLQLGTGSGVNSLAAGTGVAGNSTSSTGSAAGVMGTGASSAGYGVEGSSPNVGVYGTASGAKGYGVEGSSPNVGVFGAGTGSSGIGVDGHGAGIGVKGVATASTGLAGLFQGNVLAENNLTVNGNADQARSMGGFVKALAYVDPTLTGTARIVRCFNSQNGSSTPPCGLNFIYVNLGDYILDFGFKISDRFVQVTPVYVGGGFDEYLVSAAVCQGTCSSITSSQIEVVSFYPSGRSVPNPPTVTNTPFFITVF